MCTTEENIFIHDKGKIISLDYSYAARREIIIPKTLDGYIVYSIGENAFNGAQVRAVSIPESVRFIERLAFGKCIKLQIINGITNNTAIHIRSFEGSNYYQDDLLNNYRLYLTDEENKHNLTDEAIIAQIFIKAGYLFESEGSNQYKDYSIDTTILHKDNKSILLCNIVKSSYRTQDVSKEEIEAAIQLFKTSNCEACAVIASFGYTQEAMKLIKQNNILRLRVEQIYKHAKNFTIEDIKIMLGKSKSNKRYYKSTVVVEQITNISEKHIPNQSFSDIITQQYKEKYAKRDKLREKPTEVNNPFSDEIDQQGEPDQSFSAKITRQYKEKYAKRDKLRAEQSEINTLFSDKIDQQYTEKAEQNKTKALDEGIKNMDTTELQEETYEKLNTQAETTAGTIDRERINQVMLSYKERLINVSSKNNLLYTSKIDGRKRLDLGSLVGISISLINKLYTREELLCSITKDNFLTITEEMTQNEILVNTETATGRLIKLNKNMDAIIKQNNDFKNETGRHSIYVGYPFIEGKCINKEIFRGPLFLFPVDIAISNSKINIKQLTGADIVINRVLFLALIKNSGLKIKDLTEYEVQSLEPDLLPNIRLDAIQAWLKDLNIETLLGDKQELEPISKTTYEANLGEYTLTQRAVLGLYDPINSIYEDYQLLCNAELNDNINKLMGMERITGSISGSKESVYTYKEVELNSISDLDSSQEAAVYKSTKSNNLVIYGPPGTGKSQVIANIISNGLAKGKRILVVSQKRAALEVVYNRLGILNNNALMIHSNVSKREFYDKIVSTIENNTNYEETDDISKISNKADGLIDKLDGVFEFLNENDLSNSYKKCIEIYSKFTAQGKSEMESVYIQNRSMFDNVTINELSKHIDYIQQNNLITVYESIKYIMENFNGLVQLDEKTDIIINEAIRLLDEYSKLIDLAKNYTEDYELEHSTDLEDVRKLTSEHNTQLQSYSIELISECDLLGITNYYSIGHINHIVIELKKKFEADYSIKNQELTQLISKCKGLLGLEQLAYKNYDELMTLLDQYASQLKLNIAGDQSEYDNNDREINKAIDRLNNLKQVNYKSTQDFIEKSLKGLAELDGMDFNTIITELEKSKESILLKLNEIAKDIQMNNEHDRYIKREFEGSDLDYTEFIDISEEVYVNKIIQSKHSGLTADSEPKKDGLLGLFQSSTNKKLVEQSLKELSAIKEIEKANHRKAIRLLEIAKEKLDINKDIDEMNSNQLAERKKLLIYDTEQTDKSLKEAYMNRIWLNIADVTIKHLQDLASKNVEITSCITKENVSLNECNQLINDCIIVLEFEECSEKLKEVQSLGTRLTIKLSNIKHCKIRLEESEKLESDIETMLENYHLTKNIETSLEKLLGNEAFISIQTMLFNDHDNLDNIKYAMINRLEVVDKIEKTTATPQLRELLEFAYTHELDSKQIELLLAFRLEEAINKNEASNKTVIESMQNFDKVIKDIHILRRQKAKAVAISTNAKISDNWRNNSDYSKFVECKRQASTKKKRQIRKFTSDNWELLRGMFPLWLMTPDNVSKILPLENNLFDMVIFDEASQMYIEYALPSIFRGKKVVIAGDDKQLKPDSTFNSRFNTDNEDIEEIAVMEEQSLLDLAKIYYDSVQLKFHYRSKKSELIDFSNYAFYGGQLRTAPNISKNDTERPINYIKVDEGLWEKNCNPNEAQRVVSLLENILKTKGKRTVGIITFNVGQSKAIEDAIIAKLSLEQNSKFGLLYTKEQNRVEDNEDKSIFVKNIENVQGDERDIIIFSIGYAKNSAGKVNNSFGSLSTAGGENRLNVAVSRAKEEIHVVSSIYWHELSVENSKNLGPYLFQQYLKYSEAVSNNEAQLRDEILKSLTATGKLVIKTTKFDSPFEEQVYNSLVARGYDVDTQVGTLGYRIDLAIYDKDIGKYLVGIECDGATYHSSKNARERDISRQTILETKGWKIHRIWSRDWWKDSTRVLNNLDEYVARLRGDKPEVLDMSILGELEVVGAMGISEEPKVIEDYYSEAKVSARNAIALEESTSAKIVKIREKAEVNNTLNSEFITTPLDRLDTSECTAYRPLKLRIESIENSYSEDIKYWKDILIQTINHLIVIHAMNNSGLSEQEILEESIQLINSASKSGIWATSNSVELGQASKLPNYDIFIETKLASKDCVGRAVKLCETFRFIRASSITIVMGRK